MVKKLSNWKKITAYRSVVLILWWFGGVATANSYVGRKSRLQQTFAIDDKGLGRMTGKSMS